MDDDELDPTTNVDLQAQGGDDGEADLPEPQGVPRPPPPEWWQTRPGALESLIPCGDTVASLPPMSMMATQSAQRSTLLALLRM